MKWMILYRGPLSSCNYACDYCPFAKTKNTRAELAADAAKLNRFVNWLKSRKENIELLIAPWGEALIRKYYQEALTTISHLPNVSKITIQTNLSCPTKWMDKVNKNTFSLWTTFHPSQISLEKFTKKTKELDFLNIKYTVGFVAIKEELNILKKLRTAISPNVYVWANAYKRIPNYYSKKEVEEIISIDSFFEINNQNYISKEKKCSAGHRSFSIDGDGNMMRCNFIKAKIGNIYDLDFEKNLQAKTCTNETCKCYIGYIHLEHLALENIYDGLWERMPRDKRKEYIDNI